jgi:hypothetical protein
VEYAIINIFKSEISAPTRALQYHVREQSLVACKKLHRQLFACHDAYQARVFSLQINDKLAAQYLKSSACAADNSYDTFPFYQIFKAQLILSNLIIFF